VPGKVVHIAGVMAGLGVCPARPVRGRDLYSSPSRLPGVHAVMGQELPDVAGAQPVTGPGMQM
jgi:hypothetical protein